MKTVSDTRSEFLSYFHKQGHAVVPSSSVVPESDPTLLFTNSGMVQFKNVFTGKETRAYKRAATAQKCIRAGGKHNDLENVGYTARHHTFFEMLGNFSFGDYFKEEAIAFAWELVTKNYGLAKDRLCVTVFIDDDEAADLWKKIAGLDERRIIRIPTSDNFWMMGDTGPCGPCSEIFYDHGESVAGGPPGSEDADGDRFIEIWNLVFMQYEQIEPGNRVPLPKPSIDTGMGLERLAAILQGQHNNYDIDLLSSLTDHVADLTGRSLSPSHRVIADHVRAASFLIADGVFPSNEGRGYVLRRIMRRGMRHAHLLGAKDPLLFALVPTLLGKMGDAYPELRRAQMLITETVRSEEIRFQRTLETGLRLLDEETATIQSGGTLAGSVAFKLYDTYGFPLDLTQDALKAKGITVDQTGFDTAMAQQRALARKNWAGSGDAADEKIWFDLLDTVGPSEFLGYERDILEAKIMAIIKDGVRVDRAKDGDTCLIITNQTPFYAESGGQVGDQGRMMTERGTHITVTDCQKKLGALWVHVCQIEHGSVQVGEAAQLKIDPARRAAIRANHSATHLLHEALRQKVGLHIAQKGSRVDDRTLRFDVSQPVPLSAEQLEAVEHRVNAEIRANMPVETRVMPLDAAMESGAIALFGEKYGDEVRVVSMGSQEEGKNHPFSVELCGGTHVRRTGDIGLVKIISEGAVSAGVRRIEAMTGQTALAYLESQEKILHSAAAILKVTPADMVARVTSLVDDKRRLENELSTLRRQMAAGGGAADGTGAGDSIKTIGGVKFTSRILKDFPARDLKPMVDDLKTRLGSGVIAALSVADGKVSLVVGVTDDLTPRISAVDLVRVAAEKLGGQGGGGRPDMAQAGGPNGDSANDAVASIEQALAG